MPAAEDLEGICAWIERDNPEVARRVAKTIYDGCGQLKDFPNMGRASRRMSGRRELAFPPLPYLSPAACVKGAYITHALRTAEPNSPCASKSNCSRASAAARPSKK